jgi:hypothetical protein
MATENDAGSRQPADSKKPQDLTDHNCINLRLATYGGCMRGSSKEAAVN